MVPDSAAIGTPCSSAATMKSASTGSTAPFIVIDTLIVIERDAGEQRAHVVDRIDRDARHADVAGDARMIGIIAAMGGEIEGDREALLPRREIGAIEGVGILGGREARILAHRPGLVDVHRRIGAAQIGRQARPGVEKVEAGKIVGVVERLDVDPLGRQPVAQGGVRGGRPARREKGIEAKSGIGAHRSDPLAAGRADCGARAVARELGFRCARSALASASQPAKMKSSTPAARNGASRSPGLPASTR